MQEHSKTAWDIASKYSRFLASETRDLAAWIDNAIAEEREACAKIAHDTGARYTAEVIRARSNQSK